MSDFADAYVERLKYLRDQPNKFEFDDQGCLLLIPNNADDYKRAQEFLDTMRKKIREKIAQEIEADYAQQLADGLGNYFGLSEEFCYKQAAAIARGQ